METNRMSLKKPPRDQVSARLDPDVRKTIERVAEIERRPISSVIRNVLTDWVKAHKNQQGMAA
jgi:predicted transcriptional regulator